VRFADEPRIQVITRHQWTPELAQDVVEADAVLFVDCSVHGIPGEVQLVPIQSAQGKQSLFATHHLAPSELLAMSQELYGKQPRRSLLLTLGAFSIELREGFSKTIEAALPLACAKLEKTVLEMLAGDF
jgi:hydrogenase maturation protease